MNKCINIFIPTYFQFIQMPIIEIKFAIFYILTFLWWNIVINDWNLDEVSLGKWKHSQHCRSMMPKFVYNKWHCRDVDYIPKIKNKKTQETTKVVVYNIRVFRKFPQRQEGRKHEFDPSLGIFFLKSSLARRVLESFLKVGWNSWVFLILPLKRVERIWGSNLGLKTRYVLLYLGLHIQGCLHSPHRSLKKLESQILIGQHHYLYVVIEASRKLGWICVNRQNLGLGLNPWFHLLYLKENSI